MRFSHFRVNQLMMMVMTLMMMEMISWLLAAMLGLLWRAPELLRDPNALPRGSQKGDVYSYAFILYEIHGRYGPWGDTALTAKGRTLTYRSACVAIMNP